MNQTKRHTIPKFYLLMLLFLTSCLSKVVDAHALEQSYIFLSINDTSIDGRVEITIEDLNRALLLDLPTDQSVTEIDLQPHINNIQDYFKARISIDFADGLDFDEFFLHVIPKAQYLALRFSFKELTEIPAYIDFEYDVLFDVYSEHLGFVIIENDWRSGTFDDEGNIALIFTPDDTKRRLDLSTSTVAQGYFEMLKLGIHHIWEGIDHILFLLALLLPAVVYRKEKHWQATESFYPAFIYTVKIVTVFTIAHTITLSAATLGLLSLSSRIVESIIAISIAIAALDILYPVFRGKIWSVVFIFGLFHGFGFASVLGDYAIPQSYLTWSLLAFNLGVEVGQVAIVAVVFPIFYLLRQYWFYPKLILRFGAVALIMVSLYWFIERGFLIDLPAGELLNWLLSPLGIKL